MPMTNRQRWLVRGSLVLLVAAGVAVLALVPPTAATFYPKCQFHQMTGLHCPGCGTTRALHSLLNGRVGQAFAYNAVVVLAFPLVGVWAVRRRLCGPMPHRWATVLAWGSVGLMTVFGIVRNVPVYPLNLLAPHDLP